MDWFFGKTEKRRRRSKSRKHRDPEEEESEEDQEEKSVSRHESPERYIGDRIYYFNEFFTYPMSSSLNFHPPQVFDLAPNYWNEISAAGATRRKHQIETGVVANHPLRNVVVTATLSFTLRHGIQPDRAYDFLAAIMRKREVSGEAKKKTKLKYDHEVKRPYHMGSIKGNSTVTTVQIKVFFDHLRLMDQLEIALNLFAPLRNSTALASGKPEGTPGESGESGISEQPIKEKEKLSKYICEVYSWSLIVQAEIDE